MFQKYQSTFSTRVSQLLCSSVPPDVLHIYPLYQFPNPPSIWGLICCYYGPEWHFWVYRDGTWWEMYGDEQCGEIHPDERDIHQFTDTEENLTKLGFVKK